MLGEAHILPEPPMYVISLQKIGEALTFPVPPMYLYVISIQQIGNYYTHGMHVNIRSQLLALRWK